MSTCTVCGGPIAILLAREVLERDEEFPGRAGLLMWFPCMTTTDKHGPRVLTRQKVCCDCLAALEEWRDERVRELKLSQ